MKFVFFIFTLALTSTALAAIQERTFDPKIHVFYGGLGSSTWWSDSPALCGVDLVNNCWGHTIAYVKENTPAGSVICSTLLVAKASKTEVDFIMEALIKST